jgi:hypothetical protein
MKSLIAAAFVVLVPSILQAQNPQFTDCRSFEIAGNFIGPDEALVNGLVCKMAKPKATSAASKPAVEKDQEKSRALLGIIEPETLRSKDKEGGNAAPPARGASLGASGLTAGKSAVKSMALLGVIEPETLRSKEKDEIRTAGEPQTPEVSSGFQSSSPTANGVLQTPSFEKIPEGSLGSIARSYRMDAEKQVAARPGEEVLQQKKLSAEAERVATKTDTAPVMTSLVEAKPAAVPRVSEVATPQTARKEAIAAPTARPVETKAKPIAESVAPVPAAVAVKTDNGLPAAVATPGSIPKRQDALRTETLAKAETLATQAQSGAGLAASSAAETPAKEPERERGLNLGAFVAPKPALETDGPPQRFADGIVEESAFQEGQAANCTKNISLGSMEKEKLFLAIPEWALKWYEKNQKKFPGICFSNSLMPGAQNYLVVFYTEAPRVAGADSLKNISTTDDITPVTGKGSFTTSYGGLWHYTYDRTVTTTITSLSPEKAPHNQEAGLLYATAYSEQGIPMSQHWPAPNTKPSKEAFKRHGKNQNELLQEFRVMADLLGQMVEDIAKL